MWVDSEVAKGSVFYFKVPLKVKTPHDSTPLADRITSHQMAASKSLSILVVDDNDLNLMIAKRILDKKGHQVCIAKNGREALKKIRSEIEGIRLPLKPY